MRKFLRSTASDSCEPLIDEEKECGFYSDLMERFCRMMGLQIEWRKSNSCYGSHTLTIHNGKTFTIRHLRETLFPGTRNPTHIGSTYVTPTSSSYEECCKKMIEMSLGKWWTGYKDVSGKELRKLPPGCSVDSRFIVGYDIKFPDSVEQLELKLDINGF